MIYKIDINALRSFYEKLLESYNVVSPVEENGVIMYKENPDFNRLPFGKFQIESAGNYTLTEKPGKYFSYVRPYNSPKNFLRPPQEILFKVYKKEGTLYFEKEEYKKSFAFFDVRKCDLKAISTLDDVYINKNNHPDENYKNLRENALIIAVNCSEVSDVCFCDSMGIDLNEDYISDIVLTELEDGFLLEVKTEKGKDILKDLKFKNATKKDLQKKEEVLMQTSKKIRKKLNTENLKEILYRKIEHPYWEELGS
uniref:hypothetical protein n=1 Tax=Sulfurihydrogenibium sp. TaxID=2053621 RepID=UPI00260A5F84